jgi:predicted phosphoribosyltransferase
MIFVNRFDAGTKLGKLLSALLTKDDKPIVYALVRGGAVVGDAVAEVLNAPFDVVLVSKIGHPSWPEYAIGAIAGNDEPVYNQAEIEQLNQLDVAGIVARERNTIAERQVIYFNTHKPISARNKTAIIVDDGIATGLTARAALKNIMHQSPKQIIIAIPVGADDSIEELKKLVDKVVVVDDPAHFAGAVSRHYQSFDQVSDAEVIKLLNKHQQKPH